MGSVTSRFTSTIGTVSGITNVDNFLVDGDNTNPTITSGATFTLRGFPSNVGPNSIPLTATMVGIQFRIIVTSLSDTGLTVTCVPKIGASINGSIPPHNFTSAGGVIFGGTTNDLNIPSANFTPTQMSNFRIQTTFNSFSGTTTLQKLSAFTPIFSYTLPFSNKVYNTSGKFSITSGKVSIT
jgi:hypothetical protein